LHLLYFFALLLCCYSAGAQENLKDSIYYYDSLANERPEQFVPYLERNLRWAQCLGDEDEQSYAHTRLGVWYKKQGLYPKALAHYQQALQLHEKRQEWEYQAAVLNNLGAVYQLQGDFPQALKAYLRALKLAEEKQNYNLQQQILNHLGNFYANQGVYDRAFAYYQQGLRLVQKRRDSIPRPDKAIAFFYNNLGTLSLKAAKYEEAKKYFLSSMQIKQNQGWEEELGSSYGNLGKVFLQLQQYDSAEIYLFKALKAYEQHSQANWQNETYLQLGMLYEAQDKDDLSAQYYQKGLLAAESQGNLPLLHKIYRRLAEQAAEQGQFSEAYRLRLRYETLGDSLYNLEKNKQIQEFQTRFDQAKADQQLDSLRQYNAYQALQIEQERRLGYSFLVIALLLFLSFLLLYVRFRERQRHLAELSAQHTITQRALAHREILIKEIHHRVKNNLQIVASLLDLQKDRYGEGQPLIQAILGDCQDRIHAIALVHEKLYQSEDQDFLQLDAYLQEMLHYFEQTYDLQGKGIEIQLVAPNKALPIDQLINLGLIINELFTNSIKHAFLPQQKPKLIYLRASLSPNQDLLLDIGDNGQGLPAGLKTQRPQSLGLKLVQGIVRQLQGQYQIHNQDGTHYHFSIPIPNA
jgi:two-component sensor histidine kinase/uncharacterized protein HemY